MHPGGVGWRTPRSILLAFTVTLLLLANVSQSPHPSPATPLSPHPPADLASAGVSAPLNATGIQLTPSVSPTKGSIPLNVTFTVQARTAPSNPPTITFLWNFSDGSSPVSVTLGAGGSPWKATSVENHTFSAVGTYAVTVNVSDGGIDPPTSVTLHAVAVPAMAMVLNFAPPSGDVGQKIVITPNVTGGAPPYHIAWASTPTGCVAGAANLTCIAPAPGQYSVKVTASDSVADRVTVTANFTVNPRLGLVANYHSSYTCNGPVGTGAFNFTAILVGGASPITVTWSFGDGTPSASGTTVVHEFPSSGNYTVTVVAVDAAGVMASQSIIVSTGFPACAAVAGPSYSPPLWVLEVGIGIAAAFVVILFVALVRPEWVTRQRPPQGPPASWAEGSAPGSKGYDEGTGEAGEPEG